MLTRTVVGAPPPAPGSPVGSGYFYADPYAPVGSGGGSGGGWNGLNVDPYGMSDLDYSDLYDGDMYEDGFLPVDPYAQATPRDPYAPRAVASNAAPYDPYSSVRPGGEPEEITSEHVVDSVQRLQEALVIAAQEGDVGHLRQLINARGDPKDAHTVVMRQFAIGQRGARQVTTIHLEQSNISRRIGSDRLRFELSL